VQLALAAGLTVPLGLDTYIPAPDDNPITVEKAGLGGDLFRDVVLSRDRTISCATCHEAERAFTDAHPLAKGIDGRAGDRRTPAIINRAFGKRFFWDGRTATLEEQVLQPVFNPKEMDLSVDEAVQRLRGTAYGVRFEKIFGRAVNRDDLARALATFVRTILAGDSPYDRFVAGDRSALNAQAQLGLKLFRGKAGCIRCHVGGNLSDDRLHRTGAGARDSEMAFKTPTLREVAGRAPYMHDGSIGTLDEIIDFYDKGGIKGMKLDPEIHRLGLSDAEKKALVEFLRSLSGRVQAGYR
jgi:cytochrome c peroxidase